MSKQSHLKHEASCCDIKKTSDKNKPISDLFSDQQKRKLIENLLLSKAQNLNLKTCELIKDHLFINYLKQSEINYYQNDKKEKKIEVENDKNSVLADIRNPYVEETEVKYVKEPVPYGNPFKLVLRSKTQKVVMNGEISDEAYLANTIQEKDIKKSMKTKESPSILKKKKNNDCIFLCF